MTGTGTVHTAVRHYRDTPQDAAAVRGLMLAAIAAGELIWITPHGVQPALDLSAATPSGTLLALEGDTVVGVFLTGWSLLLVEPQARRRGHGRALVTQALAESPQPESLELSPPVGNAVAESFAHSLGFAYIGSFWRLRLSATTTAPVPVPAIPAGYTLRHLRPGADDAAYMHAVNTAFIGHTPPIALTPESLERAYAQPDFSVANIAVIVPDDEPDAIVAVGRVHVPVSPDGVADVDLLGVLPQSRGLGLGRELLRWAVTTLRERGHDDILLNVEGHNARALTLYTNHGFRPDSEWPRWTLASAGAATP